MTEDPFNLPAMPVVPSDGAEEVPIHEALLPLAFLLGTWRGVGVGGYPGVPEFRFGQEIEFSHRGTPVMAYRSTTWLLTDDGELGRPTASEHGFWRPQPDRRVEVILAHSMGVAEVWVGAIDSAKVELTTDVVVRTDSAKEITGGTRLYGLVEGRLLYAYDMAAMGHELQPHVSARLDRVGGPRRPFLDYDPMAG